MNIFQKLKVWFKKLINLIHKREKLDSTQHVFVSYKEKVNNTSQKQVSKKLKIKKENIQKKSITESLKEDSKDSTGKDNLPHIPNQITKKEFNLNEVNTKFDFEGQKYLLSILIPKEDKLVKKIIEIKPYKRQDIDSILKKESDKEIEINISPHKTDNNKSSKKSINLGEKRRYKKRVSKSSLKIKMISDKNKTSRKRDDKKRSKILKPYIEFDVNKQRVSLVFPAQQISIDKVYPKDLHYKLDFNGTIQNIPMVTETKENNLLIKLKRIQIVEPLSNVNIKFPEVFKFEELNYFHKEKNIYIFASYSKSKFIMHYLNDNRGGVNPIPRKDIWVLLNESCELNSKPNTSSEVWIWENYKPAFFKLKGINELSFQNSSGDFLEIPYENNFILEGNILKEGFFEESPLFIGNSAKLISKYKNPQGWKVWVQNKQLKQDKLINENWTGYESLEILLPEFLPSTFGEFQLSICNQYSRKPIDTIFFRYIPFISINYKDNLILPLENGHIDDEVEVLFKKDPYNWKIIGHQNFENIKQGYKLLVKDNDTVIFNIKNINNPRIRLPLKINLKKLIWKLSNSKDFTDKEIELNRDEILMNQNLYLNVFINSDENYEIEAVLLQDIKELQTIKLKKNRGMYNCLLSILSDTITSTNSVLSLLLRIYENNEHIAEITVLKTLFKDIICKICKESFVEINNFHSHLVLHHWSDFIETLRYDEVRIYNPSLPIAIYKCQLCKKFLKINNPENPTSFVEYHINYNCNYPKEKIKGIPIDKCYLKINKIDTIKKHVYPKLTKLYECKICKKVPRNHDSKESNLKAILYHFYSHHQNEFFYYK